MLKLNGDVGATHMSQVRIGDLQSPSPGVWQVRREAAGVADV